MSSSTPFGLKPNDTPRWKPRHEKRHQTNAVDPYERGHAPAKAARRLDHHVASHRVADEDGALEIERFYDRGHVPAECLDRPFVAIEAGFPVPGGIEGYDPELPGEGLELPFPVAPIARPPVDEDESWQAFAS